MLDIYTFVSVWPTEYAITAAVASENQIEDLGEITIFWSKLILTVHY